MTEDRKHLLLVTRYPGIDRLPNLRSLVAYLADHGYSIDVVCPAEEYGTQPAFAKDWIRIHEVPINANPQRKFVCPVTIKLFWKGLLLGFQHKGCLVMGGERIGNVLAMVIARLIKGPMIAFVLEYPVPRNALRHLLDHLEYRSLRSADLVIAFDEYHARFLDEETGVPDEKFAFLPNGTPGTAQRLENSWLPDIFGIPKEDSIILHSGGLGPWFDAIELAQAAKSWPETWHMVFHTSRKIPTNSYLDEFHKHVDDCKVILHNDPVPSTELDKLVSSAHIGIALYSLKELGYRAELMGLAAGKIGQYLKNGLPVVATDVPSIRKYIEGYNCGICVKSADGMQDAIKAILSDYERYRNNAFRCFNALWATDHYCARILQRFESFGIP